jgi:DNA modification methylase
VDKHLEIGLERTLSDYIERLVLVFREVRRVLAADGVVFLNLGDSYNAYNGNRGDSKSISGRINLEVPRLPSGYGLTEPSLKAKDRLMVPARVAIALQDDGWWLRDEIVWHKPRATPFPLKDRTVPAHEMVYLLTKSDRYYFDYEAVQEPAAYPGVTRKAGKAFRDLAEYDPIASRKRQGADREIVVSDMRLARSVWSISPSPYKDGHFATMPPELAERCIKAGSRPGDVVLDPFAGAGTTGLVADRLGCDAILIELNEEYADMARRRLVKDAPLLAEVSHA